MNKLNICKIERYYKTALLLSVIMFFPTVNGANFPLQLKVDGNQKTREKFIHHLVEDCLKDRQAKNWSEVKKAELQQCIFDSKFFSQVRIEIAEPVIYISVVERLTIIPIPMVQSSENSNSAGIFLIDTHFMGMGKQAAIGGVTGDRGNSFFLSYRDPAINFSHWTASTSFSKRQTDYQRYEKDNAIDGYTETGNAADVSLGYKLLPSFETGIQLRFNDSSYQIFEAYTLLPENYRYSRLGFFIDYNQTDFHFYFQEGHKLRAQISTQLSRNDEAENATDFELNYDWQMAVLNEHALQFKLESRISDSDDIRDSYKPNGSLGYRGVEPGSIWTSQSHAISVDYKIPFFNRQWGVWTIGPFANYAIFNEFDTDARHSSTAYGANIYMFLKGIALPGIGIMVGRNDDYLGDFVSLSIGFGLH